jgi:hypothetical protein
MGSCLIEWGFESGFWPIVNVTLSNYAFNAAIKWAIPMMLRTRLKL